MKSRHMQRHAVSELICRWYIIISSPPGTNFPCGCVFRAVVQCSTIIIPHWGTMFTSTPVGPIFAANFCPTGTEVKASSLPRHWRGSRYLSPLETDYHFGPTGSEVGAAAKNLSRRDRFSKMITLSLCRVPAGPVCSALCLSLKCLLHRTSVPSAQKLKCGPGGAE